MFCTQPFNRIEIYENGDVFNCCPPFIDYYKIGNIFSESFDDIWNGEKIRDLRKKILNNDYSLCADMCNRKNNSEENNRYNSDIINEYPEEISISSDNVCNVKCKICRDENYHTDFDKNKLNDEIDDIWLPIFKNAKLLRFGCSGEPFASYKEMQIIKRAAEKYSDLKFHIHTNGILGDKKKLDELKITERIHTITVSIHSANWWTYRKIVRGGNYCKVKQNLKFYSDLKTSGKIQQFRMIFVVYSDNYKEMPKFAKIAKKLGATAEFWSLRQSEAKICKEFDKYSITNPNHKKYKDFLKILNNKIFDSKNVILYPELKSLRNTLEK